MCSLFANCTMECIRRYLLLLSVVFTFAYDCFTVVSGVQCEVNLKILNASDEVVERPCARKFYYRPARYHFNTMEMYAAIEANTTCLYNEVYYRWRFHRLLPDTTEVNNETLKVDAFSPEAYFNFFHELPALQLGYIVLNATVIYDIEGINASFSKYGHFLLWSDYWEYSGCDMCFIQSTLDALNITTDFLNYNWCDEDNYSTRTDNFVFDTVLRTAVKASTAIFSFDSFAPYSASCDSSYGSCIKVNPGTDIAIRIVDCKGFDCPNDEDVVQWRFYSNCLEEKSNFVCQEIIREEIGNIHFPETFNVTVSSELEGPLKFAVSAAVKLVTDEYAETHFVIKVNEVPTGSCMVAPLVGYQEITSFNVYCSGYDTDPDSPITYKFYLTGNSSSTGDVLLQNGTVQNLTSLLFEQSGEEERNYTVCLKVIASDAMGLIATEQNLLFQVRPGITATNTGAENILEAMSTMITVDSSDDDSDNFLTSMIHTGDVDGAMNLISVISTALSDSTSNNTVEDDARKKQRAEIREAVISSLHAVPVTSEAEIGPVISSLNSITSVKTEITEKAKEQATEAYLTFVDAFQNISTTSSQTAENVSKLLFDGSANLLDVQLSPSDEKIKDASNNTVNQKKAKASVGKILEVVQKAADVVLNFITPDAPPKLFSTSKMDIVVAKSSSESIAGKSLVTSRITNGHQTFGSILLPNDTTFRETLTNESHGEAIGIQVLFYDENPYTWNDYADAITAPVLDFSLKDNEKHAIAASDQMEPFHIELSTKDLVTDSFVNICNISVISNMTGTYYSLTKESYIVMRTTLDSNDTRMLTITTNNITLDFTVFVSQNETPTLDVIQTFGFNVSSISGFKSSYTVFDLFSGLNETVSNISIGIVPVLNSEFDAYARNFTKNCAEEQCSVVPVGFILELYTVSCKYWDPDSDVWKDDGCKVSNTTTLSKIHCECNHLTAFSGSLLVQPNFVDPFSDAALFLTFFSNPVVVTTVVVIWIIYLLILCWVQKIDRKDQEKAGIIVVADNNPDDTYLYQICVMTAWWRNAGTTANVSLYLSGEEGQSARHCLKSDLTDSEQIFESGSEDWFVITTPKSLGRLHSLSVWHDNSGKSPSWCLSRIMVTDIQTSESWIFPYGTWIAVNMGSMSTKVTLPAYTEEEIASHRGKEFVFKSSRDLRDGHLWISIVSKPSRSAFTRVQRLSCALSLLLMTMLTSIMFHGIPTDDAEDQAKLGDITISLADIVIGIESSLIMFPINLIILQIFMRIAKKPEKPFSKQCYRPAIDKVNSESSLMELKVENPKIVDKVVESKSSQEKQAKLLPWWFVYVGWILVISTSIVSSYFVMLYGLMYGPRKSVDWLVSFFTSFFQSAFITQPLKVVGIAVVVTMILKKPQIMKSKPITAADFEATSTISGDDQKAHVVPDPLANNLIKSIQKKLWLDEEVKRTLTDIVLYITFVIVVLFIVHGHRSVEESYQATQVLEDIFVNTESFHDVSRGPDLWKYFEENIKQNLNDMANSTIEILTATSCYHLIGNYRLRQLRIKPDSCSFPEVLQNKYSFMSTCDDHYWIGDEDTLSYNESWSSLQTDNMHNGPWAYRSAWDLKTIPFMGKHATYSGGGYVLEVKPNSDIHSQRISQLQNSQWLDERTRAVFVEFTLFNPNNNMFSALIIAFEFTNIGAIFPYYQIFTTRLYHYGSELETFVAICEVCFIIYNLVFTYNEIKQFRKLGRRAYFQEFWSCIEVIQIGLSYSVIGLFFQRMVVVNNVIDELKRSDNKSYISFYLAVSWDYIFTYVTAFLVIIVILKTFKLLKFNKKMFLVVQTLRYAKGDLISYLIFSSSLIMAFAHFSLLQFGSSVYDYREFGQCLITLFNFCLGVSDFDALVQSNRILGPIFFLLFMFLIHISLIYIFVSIMNASFKEAKDEAFKSNPDLDVVEYIWSRLSNLI